MAGPQVDIESARDEKEYLHGFADFSHFIASDFSLSIYRKFAALGARNILYLQAELQLLEIQLKELDDADKRTIGWSNDETEKLKAEAAARSWEDMRQQASSGNKKQAEKLRMIYRIRKVMREYETEEALLRRNQVLQLEKPDRSSFNAFKTWFRRELPVLWGSGFRLLRDEDDMVALGSQDEPDRMSALIHQFLGYRLRAPRETPKSWGPMYYYPVERVALIVAIISVLISAALLVAAIMALYFVKPIGARLTLVGVFTTLFAASITLLTHAKRVEVYGATAAYAAVLVVFISVNN